ncbi:MAG: hypothetical protein HY510_01555, partial [Acidobacteria bacterium]|nr:hypothetical protein [Acidobacteriota bacterium]
MSGPACGPRGPAGNRSVRRRAAALGALLLSLAVSAFGSGAGAAAAGAAPPADPVAFMPLESVRPGMVGTARTVFEGENFEEFGVEILGVLKNAVGPDQDLILARLRGDKVEYTGVVSGMSGSPVYVDGKLVGALSYRVGPFAKEAIAGITPIADMLKLAGEAGVSRGGRVGAAPDLLGRFLSGAAAAEDSGSAPPWRGGPSERLGVPVSAAARLQPIGIPLICSGCDAGVLRHYAPIFESYGLEPAAGGGMVEAGKPLPLAPGTPIGGALVTGSLS